jgi:hypothetical protein
MKKGNKLLSLVFAFLLMFGVAGAANASTVNGKIGKATVLKTTALWKLGSKNHLSFTRNLQKGAQYWIYSYTNVDGGLYGVGAGYYVKKNPSYIKYETLSSHPSVHPTSVSKAPAAAVSSSSLNVRDGQYASVTVKTKPYATGTIEVIYKSGPSKAKGLVPEKANASGYITWTWKVGTNTTPGTYPVIIHVNGSTITKYVTVH